METCLHAARITSEDFVVVLQGEASRDNVPVYLLTENIIVKL